MRKLLTALILSAFFMIFHPLEKSEAVVLLQETKLTKHEMDLLVLSLEKKTGLSLVEDNGALRTKGMNPEGWSWWNPMGKFIRALLFLNCRTGSPTARTLLGDSIASSTVYRVRSNRDANLGRVFRGKAIDLDFSDVNRLTFRDIPRETFDAGMIFLHELVHLRERLTDPTLEEKKTNADAKGDTVEYVNRIHRELSLPERLHYFPKKSAARKGVWSIYFGNQNGRVELDEELFF